MYLRKAFQGAVKRQVFVRPAMRPLSTEATTNAMINEVAEQQKERAARVVPWFLKTMPPAYFQQTSVEMQAQHVQAIATIKELSSEDTSLRMATRDADGTSHITCINSGTASGLLHSQIKTLEAPEGMGLSNVNVFSSLDSSMALNVFSFAHAPSASAGRATAEDAKRIFEYATELRAGKHADNIRAPKYSEDLFNDAALTKYISHISPHYARKSNPRRFFIQRELYEKVRGSDGTEVHIEPGGERSSNPSASWVTIAAANVLPDVLLRLCSDLITHRGLDIGRAHLDSVLDISKDDSKTVVGNVTMLRLLVSTIDEQGGGRNLNTDSVFAATLSRDLKRAKWLDHETTDLGLDRHPSMGLDKAEVITALCSMLHGPLNKADPQTFSSVATVINVLESHHRYMNVAERIAELFLQRFDPNEANPLSAAEFEARYNNIQKDISSFASDAAVTLLGRMLFAVKCTLRTNFFNEDRYALSLRVQPEIMATGDIGKLPTKPMPFGVFFVHGRHFNAFHNRFRDIARGGLRLVTPPTTDQHALESSRQYDEVYGLSFAQQMKNKDIPEGGAKGVILVNTPLIEPSARPFAMRKAVKAFTDSMLDLIVDDSVSKLVDFYNKDELIYFGPDEQIIPDDIEWMVQRAAVRGYPLPAAVMSSKGENGFNHKEYGVTSEGVVVYLDVALRRSLGINPNTDPFTVKITGGPDGDVAGNLILIMHREYGDNCKVVGIADGFGVAEDPNGLNMTELLRLVKEGLPITSFDKSKLTAQGVMLDTDVDKEGMERRNTMWSRVKADAFVPAGGRPNTVNGDNWRNFLDADGAPTSKLIVEGANIFITPEARTGLFEEAGVAIVKDSSANKCGVMTSSAEVQASMLISKEEFMANKPEIVDDVLHHLRRIARLEGELLFREYNNYPGALPHFSERISIAIAKVTDAVTDALADVEPSDPLFQELTPLLREGLPNKLLDIGGDRLSTNLPVQYQRNAIASALASKLVYKEGIHLVETQPDDVVASRAFSYYRKEMKINQLLAELEASGKGGAGISDESKKEIMDILHKGGARASLNVF
mmetsp:Transcript_27165/g.55373  ORF Transcript_27165/g.55373 Transcript_27165/m.55373 type:complete len:1060 (-) Transcript_27165:115-3294(-)|eukprot:CAMPEP_0181323750 /NCGR_PEP_ID=MMETSP1101-20121128/19970_1 /TAXON_ID=46948 /ORGANISM="Rhodomonas abbreviata, Strain Caron Lab Isolate" /LENGTH=1059 /DNA_ID=CAMNT_0023431835 /DNA_START=37 /DNA_END=3216 /DNA_ORIENTATION=-